MRRRARTQRRVLSFVVLFSSFFAPVLSGCFGSRSTPPPDPATIAPPLSPNGVTPFYEATEFLYKGEGAIQTGVVDGAMQEYCIAVPRGRVLDRDGNPLSGVTVTIHDHPEFGQTLSREDGMFDLVVNGGGWITIDYCREYSWGF